MIRVIAAAQRELDQRLAAPDPPPPDWNALDASAGELEKLQVWQMHLTDEFKEILDEVDALRTEPLAGHSDARQRREGSPASIPDGDDPAEGLLVAPPRSR